MLPSGDGHSVFPLLGEQRQTQLVLACQCPSAELGEESWIAVAVLGKTNVHLKDA